jgi:hypothetical protein
MSETARAGETPINRFNLVGRGLEFSMETGGATRTPTEASPPTSHRMSARSKAKAGQLARLSKSLTYFQPLRYFLVPGLVFSLQVI